MSKRSGDWRRLPQPSITSMITNMYRKLIFASLVCCASAGCSKGEPTKDQLLSRAKDAFAAGQYDNAEKEYRAVLRLAPEDPAALRQLGIIYLDQGQNPQANRALKRYSELQPDDPEIQLKLGLSSLALGDYTQARDTAVQILEKQPGQEQALLLLVDASRTPDDMEDARKLVESLREKDQDRSGYHLALGALDLRQNDQARAEAEFKAALNLDSKSSEVYAALATLYWSRKDLKEADQAFKTAADLAPLRSPMRVRYADFLLKTGANAEAKNLLEDTSRKLPDYLPPRLFLMKMTCAEHQDEDCAARVQNILAQDPLSHDALFLDGILSRAKGDARKAIGVFEYLSNTYRQNAQVRYQLALPICSTPKTTLASSLAGMR